MTRFSGSFAPIAVSTRSDFEESLYHGAGVAIDEAGVVTAGVGRRDLIVYARSSLKPLQAHAMVILGLELPDSLLAISCASHDGSPAHMDAVREILKLYNLNESDLQNTPDLPYGDQERASSYAASDAPSAIQQNCSGKHAAMLATCQVNGWPTSDYLSSDHPLQEAIVSAIGDAGCTVHHVGIDGCGAPTFAVSLRELAAAFAALASGRSAVALAMADHPDLVGGPTRDISRWMRAMPGLMVKEGADGVLAAALPDGRAAAFKIAGGSDLARQAVTVEALREMRLDVDHDAPDTVAQVVVPVLGHGHEVGGLRALPWSR